MQRHDLNRMIYEKNGEAFVAFANHIHEGFMSLSMDRCRYDEKPDRLAEVWKERSTELFPEECSNAPVLFAQDLRPDLNYAIPPNPKRAVCRKI
jgi:hypothetical protein